MKILLTLLASISISLGAPFQAVSKFDKDDDFKVKVPLPNTDIKKKSASNIENILKKIKNKKLNEIKK
jgi:hypothetical protein